MSKLRRRAFAGALVGASAAGIMMTSAGTAFAGAWTTTPYFYPAYSTCASVGQEEVNRGVALDWACAPVTLWDGSTWYQVRLFVE